jgi:hypothetical protein
MTRLSSCPNCWRQVLVPPSAARRSRVRCPLCAAEFELLVLQEAAVPELILLESAEAEHALAEAPATAGDSALTPSSDVLGAYRGGRVWRGEAREIEAPAEPRIWEGEAPTEPYAALSPLLDPWQTETPDAAIDRGDDDSDTAESPPEVGATEAPASEEFALRGENGSAGALPSQEAPSQETLSDETPSDETPFNFYASPKTHDDGVPVEVAARQGKRREANMAVELVKVVAGGFVGLVIAYGVLLVFFKTDPLDLADSLPRWMVPAALEPDENSP